MESAEVATPAAAELPASPRFIKNEDGSVTDLKLDLVWSPVLSTECVTHADAEKLAADWGGRLPTIEELFLLADRSRREPAIDTDAFPNTPSDWFWSSTLLASSPDYAWIVNFNNGNANFNHRDSYNAFVRAVRSVAPGQ